jgi:hypothetical protein
MPPTRPGGQDRQEGAMLPNTPLQAFPRPLSVAWQWWQGCLIFTVRLSWKSSNVSYDDYQLTFSHRSNLGAPVYSRQNTKSERLAKLSSVMDTTQHNASPVSLTCLLRPMKIFIQWVFVEHTPPPGASFWILLGPCSCPHSNLCLTTQISMALTTGKAVRPCQEVLKWRIRKDKVLLIISQTLLKCPVCIFGHPTHSEQEVLLRWKLL